MKNRNRLVLVVLSLTLVLSFNADARSGIFPSFRTMAVGGLVVGAVVAHQACHDASGRLKPGCTPKKKQADTEESDLDSIQNPDDINLLRSSHTAKLRRALNIEQSASGMPPNPDDCDAHHIVPKRERREWAKDYADSARSVLESCDIDIDSVSNGVYLPGKKHKKSGCAGSYHKTLHTEDYYKDIERRLTVSRENSCDAVLDELQSIKNDLIQEVY